MTPDIITSVSTLPQIQQKTLITLFAHFKAEGGQPLRISHLAIPFCLPFCASYKTSYFLSRVLKIQFFCKIPEFKWHVKMVTKRARTWEAMTSASNGIILITSCYLHERKWKEVSSSQQHSSTRGGNFVTQNTVTTPKWDYSKTTTIWVLTISAKACLKKPHCAFH